MLQAITTVALVTAPVIGMALPLYVFVRSVFDFRRAKTGRGHLVFKTLASLAAWCFASWGMFFVLFVTVYSAAHVEDQSAAERGLPMSLLFLDLIYALIGCGLALWVRHKSEHEPVSVFTESAT